MAEKKEGSHEGDFRLLRGALGGSGGRPAQALEPLALYDDFNAKFIDPGKWLGIEVGGLGREAVREIKAKKLHMAYRAQGDTNTDSGGRFGQLSLRFADPSAITAIEAVVQVTKFEATGCSSLGSSITSASARLQANFFNTDTPISGSRLHDVSAGILVERRSNSLDPPTVLQISAFAFECLDRSCAAFSLIGSGSLGSINKGQKARLRVQWDKDQDQFIFHRDGMELIIPYSVSDTEPPGLQGKVLEITHFVPNCTATPQPLGFMEVFFDNVFVNKSAVP
ncbi:MAG: hypothetical protein HYZ72_21750 [Deltaproteobacteria bacterium]|nr:hypothetical protein [Deltaproteobacteria bacterium]